MTVFVSCEPPAALKPTGHTMYKSLVSDYVLGCVHIWCPSTSLVSEWAPRQYCGAQGLQLTRKFKYWIRTLFQKQISRTQINFSRALKFTNTRIKFQDFPGFPGPV